jgi:hypothetical protein
MCAIALTRQHIITLSVLSWGLISDPATGSLENKEVKFLINNERHCTPDEERDGLQV